MRDLRPLSRTLAGTLLLAAALLMTPTGLRAQTAQAPAAVQTSEQELAINRRARELGDQLMSPWCKGVTITQCSSGLAVSYREQIREALRTGVSEDQIKRDFASEFGENYLSMPRGPMSWTFPILILAFGAVVLGILVHRLHMPAPASAGDAPLSAEQYSKLEAELDSELKRRKLQ